MNDGNYVIENDSYRRRRRSVMRSGRETRRRGFVALTTSVLVATGIAVLLGLEATSMFLARAGVADTVAAICAVLLIGNGAMLLIPRWRFIGTIVPLMLAFGLIALSISASSFAGILIGMAAAASIGRIASWSRPRSIPTLPRVSVLTTRDLDDATHTARAA